jgi:hypothetical protein
MLKKKAEPKVTFHLVTVDPEEIERRLERIYGVIFESVLRNYQLNKKAYEK